MEETAQEIRELIRRHITSMDHLEVLMRLYENVPRALATEEIERLTHIDSGTVARCLGDLVGAALVKETAAPRAFKYAPRDAADRRAVELLAIMYSQRPVTLVRLVYDRPPAPLRSFSDAFRLRRLDEE